jgi:O-antigen/teichoic acid export membrane protein
MIRDQISTEVKPARVLADFAKRVVRISDFVRLRSFHLATERDRARERYERAAYTAAASTLARVIGLATTLIIIRVTLSYLGAERFGLWMTICSLQTFLAFADLGIGNGVLNSVAEASGRGDTSELRRYIDSGVLLLGSLSTLILVLLASTYQFLQFGGFFNLHSPLALAEARPAVVAFAACFAIEITVGLIQRVQLGLQMGFVTSLWQTAANLLALTAVLAVIQLHGGLPLLIVAFCGTPVVVKLLNGCFFFWRLQPDLAPTFRMVSPGAIRKIARLAFLFAVLNIAVALAFQSDNLVISRILGPEAVTEYSVPQKLFSLISLGIATLIEPLWPAYAEAISRGDSHWVKRALVRSLLGSVIMATLMGVTFVLLGPKLIHLWVGDRIHAGVILLIGLACWTVIQAGGNAIAMFLNGASIVKPQVIIAVVFAICALVVKIGFVQHWGIDAMPWATLLSYFCLTALPYAIIVPRIVNVVCRPHSDDRTSKLGPSCGATFTGELNRA